MTIDVDEDKKAEEQSRFLAQLQASLNVIPAYTWYAAPSGGLTFVNKRTADYLGLPKDHPLRFGLDIGAQWDAHIPFLHPDDQEGARKAWPVNISTGEASEFSFRVRNAQGGYRWFLSRVEPLRASDGSLLLWVGVNLDIEELKCAEQALRERETKIRRLVDSNVIGIFVWDFEGRFLEANDEFLRTVGYDREELLAGSTRWTDLTPPDWRDRNNARMERGRSSGRFEPFEKEYTRKDGSRVPVLIGGATFEVGGNEGVAFVLDLTERKRAEEKSRESELKLGQITETVPGLVWSNGPDGEPTHVNQRMLDYSGMPFEEFRHRGWEAFVHPADYPETSEAFWHAIQTGTSYQGVMRLRQADGEFRWHHAQCEPLRDRQGRIIQWYGLSVDIDERKKAEDRLRRSEAYLAEAERLSHTGGWAVNRKGERTIVYWSEESYRIFGFDPLQGMPTRDWVWQQVHPDDRSRLREEADAALREKRDYVAAFRILLPDGTIKYLESNAHHLFAAGGELLEVMGTFVDVTERKRAEQALRESEAKIRRLVDSNIIGIIIWDLEGRILEANYAFLRMLGYDREDLISGRLNRTDLTPPEWRERDARTVAELKTIGAVQPFDKEYFRKDGGRVPVLIGLAAFGEERDQGVAFVLDLTERKRAEEALRESEAKFRDYAETTSDWLWEVGPDYKFTLLTENAFGSDPVDRIGTACWDHALDLETESEKWRLVRATLDSRKPIQDFVYCAVGGNGSPMYVKASGRPVFDANGEFRGYRGTGTDVTAIVRAQRAEESLRTVEAELAHVSRVTTLGQLTSSIAHEVNQPITAAVTYALAARRWLSAEPPNFCEVDDALSLIVKEGNRAGEVVGRIRALIKKAPARKDAVEINDAILEVIALTRTEAANNGVSVRTQLAEGLPRVQGDRVQLQQVLLNLILNAIEAMRDVGEEERELLISSRNEPDGVSVEVRDSGPGFAPADLDRVFEAFYSTKPGGLGLGLSLCRSIIEAHNGQLRASADLPRGASFQFALPAIANTAS
jgi:PAS domain S-box-containing protein